MVSVFFGGGEAFEFLFHLRFLYFVGVFNQTIIPVAFVGNKNDNLHVARNICPPFTHEHYGLRSVPRSENSELLR